MHVPSPAALIDRVRSLPAAVPLLARLGDATGVYLVGGAVRDVLLGGEPTDLDLVVEGDAAALAARLGRARVHDRFGTSTVTLDGFAYDVARARTETYERPGALPDVAPAGMVDDLARRDFTVNAIAIALGGPQPGAVTAVPDALEDLDTGRLRVLHDQSFVDDPTRLLRLARYASRLRFAVEPHTAELLDAALRSGVLGTVSGTRVGAELRLLAREGDPLAAFGQLHALGIDAAIAPGFGVADEALARAALDLLPSDGRADLLVLALAARAVAPDALPALLESLAFEASDRDAILAAALDGDTLAHGLGRAGSPSQTAAAVGTGGPELVALAGALGPADAARRWLSELRDVRLEIDGGDLLAAGVPEGPAIGRGLRAALAAKLDGLASGRAQELAHALRAARSSG